MICVYVTDLYAITRGVIIVAIFGLVAYQSVIPNSGEQVWDDMNNNDNGITSWNNLSDTNTVGYIGNFGDIGVNLAYTDDTGGSDQHGVITYNGYDGLSIGVGGGEDGETKDMTIRKQENIYYGRNT